MFKSIINKIKFKKIEKKEKETIVEQPADDNYAVVSLKYHDDYITKIITMIDYMDYSKKFTINNIIGEEEFVETLYNNEVQRLRKPTLPIKMSYLSTLNSRIDSSVTDFGNIIYSIDYKVNDTTIVEDFMNLLSKFSIEYYNLNNKILISFTYQKAYKLLEYIENNEYMQNHKDILKNTLYDKLKELPRYNTESYEDPDDYINTKEFNDETKKEMHLVNPIINILWINDFNAIHSLVTKDSNPDIAKQLCKVYFTLNKNALLFISDIHLDSVYFNNEVLCMTSLSNFNKFVDRLNKRQNVEKYISDNMYLIQDSLPDLSKIQDNAKIKFDKLFEEIDEEEI